MGDASTRVARELPWWVGLAAASLAVGAGLSAAGLPSPLLFAALLTAMALALSLFGPELTIPDTGFKGAQAITGVVLGAYLQADSLRAVADSWLPVTLVSAGTLAVSLAAGRALARTTEADDATASLGLVAGGASGIVAIADDLGADGRLVAFMQYLRVLVVVLVTPIVAAVAFGGSGHGGGGAPSSPLIGEWSWWGITLGSAMVGGVGGRLLRLPNASLLGPLILSGAVTLAAPEGTFGVPDLLRETAFMVIGAQVGLRFTTETVRQAGRLLVPVVIGIVGVIAGCAALAVALHLTADVSLRDAYLATTPGGLYAVLAVAFGAGADTTFIVAVQGLRLLVMVILAPAAVRALVGRRRRPPA